MFVMAALAAAVAALSAPAAPTKPRAGGYWIVLGSNRDGDSRAYSVRLDGSRLTPLFARGSTQYPAAISGDGGTIAYDDPYGGGISVSRANGTGLRQLARDGGSPALSHNGRRVAFTFGYPPHIAVIGTDGGGRRKLTSGYDNEPDWSPDGKAIVFHRLIGQAKEVIVVRPLQGKERVIAEGPGIGGPESPRWSPDGRWIAYERGTENSADEGLYIVRPDGSGRHRLRRGYLSPVAWSPDGKRIAYGFGYPENVAIVRVDGRGFRRLGLRLPGRSSISALSWSPDGGHLALERGDIWVVGADGRALRRVVKGGDNGLVGWTRLAPSRSPASPLLPSERVLDAHTLRTIRPVTHLAADGRRVAFVVQSTAVDCEHVAVWTPSSRALNRFGKPTSCPDTGTVSYGIYELVLAGSRTAWADIDGCGNFCDVTLNSATLTQPRPVGVSDSSGGGGAGGGELPEFNLSGHGDLLVFNDGTRLVRIGAGSEKCGKALCTTLRRGEHAAPVESVSGELIAVREPDAVAVLDAHGTLVRVFPFGRQEVSAALLDGGRLVVARGGVLEVYDAATGAGELQRPLPSGYSLTDVDGGIAVLQSRSTIMLLRLADGRSITLMPGRGPVLADLEPPGLYYSYATAGGEGRVVLMNRADVLRRLGS